MNRVKAYKDTAFLHPFTALKVRACRRVLNSVCVHVCEVDYLSSDLRGLLGIDRAHVLVEFERVLPLLLLCTDILLEEGQHLPRLEEVVSHGGYCIYMPYESIHDRHLTKGKVLRMR